MNDPSNDDDPVFRALADPGRRALLDALFGSDGQTLTELLDVLPNLTRFGVMKHLNVLSAAALVVTRKAGREKFHYLNPVPIRRLHDWWISKFAEPWTKVLARLADELEQPSPPGEASYS